MIFTNKELLLSPFTWYESNINKIGTLDTNPKFIYIDSYNNIEASIGIESTKSLISVPTKTLTEIIELYSENFKNNIFDIKHDEISIINNMKDNILHGSAWFNFTWFNFTWYYDIEEEIALYWRFKLEEIGAILS